MINSSLYCTSPFSYVYSTRLRDTRNSFPTDSATKSIIVSVSLWSVQWREMSLHSDGCFLWNFFFESHLCFIKFVRAIWEVTNESLCSMIKTQQQCDMQQTFVRIPSISLKFDEIYFNCRTTQSLITSKHCTPVNLCHVNYWMGIFSMYKSKRTFWPFKT